MNLARKEILAGNFNKQAVNIITAYTAACILYGNGQRSGVITQLRVDEFKKREPSDYDTGDVIVHCLHHKTGTQGIARLVITHDIEKMMVEYYSTIRRKIKPRAFIHANRFFLTSRGGLYTQVYRRINESLSVGKLKPPRPKDYRIVVATDAARELNDADLRRVAKHLSHSTETSRKFYEFTNASDALWAHDIIRNLSEKRRWTKEHTRALLQEWPITQNPPSMAVCRDISQRHNMERNAKQILHKWYQLKHNYTL